MLKRILLTSLMLAAAVSAQSKLTLKVHHGAGVNGYDVNSTMISGEKDMVVIDPEFTLNDRIAAFFPDASKGK
jgi:hypothetical protein